MTVARSSIVDGGSDGVYHCMARCVRRAFLCGRDTYTGKNFDHRKPWVRSRLETLSQSFGLDVFAYAVMSNHLHVVVRTRPDLGAEWSPEEVARRWLKVFPKRRGKDGRPASPTQAELVEITRDKSRTAELRGRLSSISWFMKSLNEFIARRANREDECRGRFWEGRFKCQRLLDEAAILTCMAYVDLNPVRAGMADSLTDPQFTSAFDRIESRRARERLRHMQDLTEAGHVFTPRQKTLQAKEKERSRRAAWLASLSAKGSPLSNVSQRSYLELLDWTGRQIRADKPGRIPSSLASLLTQLEINTERWVKTVDRYGSLFYRIAGRVEGMAQEAAGAGLRWLRGIAASRQAFQPPPQPT